MQMMQLTQTFLYDGVIEIKSISYLSWQPCTTFLKWTHSYGFIDRTIVCKLSGR